MFSASYLIAVAATALLLSQGSSSLSSLRTAVALEKGSQAEKARSLYIEVTRHPDSSSLHRAIAFYRAGMTLREAEPAKALPLFLKAYEVSERVDDQFGMSMIGDRIAWATPPDSMQSLMQGGKDTVHKRALSRVLMEANQPTHGVPWDKEFLVEKEELEKHSTFAKLMSSHQQMKDLEKSGMAALNKMANSNMLMSQGLDFDAIDLYGTPNWNQKTKEFKANQAKNDALKSTQLASRKTVIVKCGKTSHGITALVISADGVRGFATGKSDSQSSLGLLESHIRACQAPHDRQVYQSQHLWNSFFSFVFEALPKDSQLVYWQNLPEVEGFNPLTLWTGSRFAISEMGSRVMLFGQPNTTVGRAVSTEKRCVGFTFSKQLPGFEALPGVDRELAAVREACVQEDVVFQGYHNDKLVFPTSSALVSLRPRVLYVAGHMMFVPRSKGTANESLSTLTAEGPKGFDELLRAVTVRIGDEYLIPPVVILSGCSSLKTDSASRKYGIWSEFSNTLTIFAMGGETVMGSLWRMDDDSGARIVGATLRTYLSGSASVARALKASQLDYLRSAQAIAPSSSRSLPSKASDSGSGGTIPPQLTAGSHPYFWGNLVVRGVDQ